MYIMCVKQLGPTAAKVENSSLSPLVLVKTYVLQAVEKLQAQVTMGVVLRAYSAARLQTSNTTWVEYENFSTEGSDSPIRH